MPFALRARKHIPKAALGEIIRVVGKPRTRDLLSWTWGIVLKGSPEHSPRTNVVGGLS